MGSNAITGFLQYEGTAYPPIYRAGMFYSEYGTQTVHFLSFTDNTYTHVASDYLLDSSASYTVDLEMGPDDDLYSTVFGCAEMSTQQLQLGSHLQVHLQRTFESAAALLASADQRSGRAGFGERWQLVDPEQSSK